MRRVALYAALLVSRTGIAEAGEVHGRIFRDNNSQASQVTVSLSCGGRPVPWAEKTDPDGNYRFFARESGSCTLSVGDQTKATADVYSYDRPTAYDFNYDGKTLTPRNTR
jgi:hypothetical protein